MFLFFSFNSDDLQLLALMFIKCSSFHAKNHASLHWMRRDIQYSRHVNSKAISIIIVWQVIKYSPYDDPTRGVSGSLLCTNFRVMFVTTEQPNYDLVSFVVIAGRDVPSRVRVLGWALRHYSDSAKSEFLWVLGRVLHHYHFNLFFCSTPDCESKLRLLRTWWPFFCCSPDFEFISWRRRYADSPSTVVNTRYSASPRNFLVGTSLIISCFSSSDLVSFNSKSASSLHSLLQLLFIFPFNTI